MHSGAEHDEHGRRWEFMTTAIICVALLGILLFGLGFAVSTIRGRTDTTSGSSGDPAEVLHKLVRSHGNTSEYAGMLAVLILLVGSREPSTWGIASMIGATASRYLLAAGLILNETMEKPHPLRFIGALGTYVFGLALCGALLRSL
jgi:uncharacterized membrane protein YecN with MAPEG domain